MVAHCERSADWAPPFNGAWRNCRRQLVSALRLPASGVGVQGEALVVEEVIVSIDADLGSLALSNRPTQSTVSGEIGGRTWQSTFRLSLVAVSLSPFHHLRRICLGSLHCSNLLVQVAVTAAFVLRFVASTSHVGVCWSFGRLVVWLFGRLVVWLLGCWVVWLMAG